MLSTSAAWPLSSDLGKAYVFLTATQHESHTLKLHHHELHCKAIPEQITPILQPLALISKVVDHPVSYTHLTLPTKLSV